VKNINESTQNRKSKPRFSNPLLSVNLSRDFKYLWLGQGGQGFAMWSEMIARNWLTYQLTGSAQAIGIVNLFRAIPFVTVGMFGGVIADRFPKRKTLMFIQFWTLSIYIMMLLLISKDLIQLWHVYGTAFCLGLGMAINQPLRTSFIPQMIDEKYMLNAMSLNSMAMGVTRLIGPAVIGYIIAVSNNNVAPAYIVSTISYLFVIATTLMINNKGNPLEKHKNSAFNDFTDGIKYMVHKNRAILWLVILGLGPLAFGFSYISLLPVYVDVKLGLGADAFGGIQSISSIGALISTSLLASSGNIRIKGKLLLLTTMVYGIGVMIMGFTNMIFVAFIIAIFIGGSQSVFRTCVTSTIVSISEKKYRGRMISMTMLDMGVASLASILAGSITDLISISYGMFFCGFMCVLIGAITFTVHRKLIKI
jgi:MFS family permease